MTEHKLSAVPTPTGSQRILELSQSFFVSRTLMSAVELGVFARLASEGPLDEASLRTALGVHPRGARDFFDGLVALGLLERDINGRYQNTPEAAACLDPAMPSYVGDWIEMASSRLYQCWAKLTDALRTGRHQSDISTTGDAAQHYELLYAEPERRDQFLRAMTGGGRQVVQEIAATFSWDEYRTVADVGCGEGAFLIEVISAHPHLHGIGFDLPQVAQGFQRRAAIHGLSERLRFRAGNFHHDPLPAAQVLVLGRVLHNWNMETKRLLLAKAFETLPERGVLIVYERMIDDARRTNLFGVMASLNMLVMTPGGFDYTAADCEKWLTEAGFPEVKATRLADTHSMVVATK